MKNIGRHNFVNNSHRTQSNPIQSNPVQSMDISVAAGTSKPLSQIRQVKTLAAASYNMQQATFLSLQENLQGNRRLPSGATPLIMPVCPVGRSSGRIVHPGLAPSIVRQAFVRPLTITGELANTGQLRPAHYQIGRYAVVGYKLQVAILC